MFNKFFLRTVIFAVAFLQFSCSGQPNKSQTTKDVFMTDKNLETATFGAGCFWCVEAIFQDLQGVYSVVAGYTGGETKNPTYKEICTGTTGHVEVAQIKYDPQEISFEELLEVFWKTHNPTTPDRQGNDVGEQYRSVIFYHDEQQQQIAEKSKKEAATFFDDPIVTTIEPLQEFYEAENYHQDYFTNNPNQPYCSYVIKPKLEKFHKEFKHKLKEQ